MKPSAAPNAPGSFISQEKMAQIAAQAKQVRQRQEEVMEAEEDKATLVEEDSLLHPELKNKGKEKSPEELEKEEQEKKVFAYKAECEEILGITITEEDARNCIFKSRVVKDIKVMDTGGKTYLGTFRTLTAKEIKEIDQKIAEFIRTGSKDGFQQTFTNDGLRDERAILFLGYAWLALDSRPLGETPSDRLTTIREMSSEVIGYATTAWNRFESLVQISLNQGKFLKKS